MKKRLIAIFASLILVVTGGSMVGCSKSDDETFSLNGISSNGGIGAVKDGYLYFIQAPTTATTYTQEEGDLAGIYKVPVDENGAMTGDPVLVYSCLAGNKLGQINIFGDYIYFSTPATGKYSSGETMTDRTTFARVKTDGTGYQKIYTGVTASITSYAYYLVQDGNDTDLYLTLLEDKTLKSIEVGDNEVEVIDEEVLSVVFSENQGVGSETDRHIYYTKSPAEDYVAQAGTNVYRAEPDGDKELISSGVDITLLAIQHGYLYFKAGTTTYRTTYGNELGKQNPVLYQSFDEFIFTEDGGIIVKNKDVGSFCYYNWTSGSIVAGKLLDSTTHELMLVDRGYVYLLTSKDAIVRVELNTTHGATAQKEVTVTSDTTYQAGDNLDYEVIGSTLYYYVKVMQKDDTGVERTSYSLKTIAL